ncbi:MAG: HAD family hydrolase [Candidatus Woesearchaeota archaeon]|nr:HAD family hydrolase [Candidatus Woesearchaeota archaeon]
MVQVIFFDTSDTLYHNDEFGNAFKVNKYKRLAEKLGISLAEATAKYKAKKEELKKTMSHPSGVFIMAEFGVDRMTNLEWVAEIDPRNFLQKDERLQQMIASLAASYKLGVITNILEKNFLAILDALGVPKEQFSYLVTADKVTKSKPYPEPFEKAVALAGVAPEECVYVGDSLKKDLIPAKNIGMKTVWVSAEAHEHEHVDAFCETIYDVLEKVDQINLQASP